MHDQDDFTDVQIESLLTASAAFCREFGFTANHWIHHREWTNRKPDMAFRGDLRGRLAALLAQPAPAAVTGGSEVPVVLQPPPPPVHKPEDVMYVVIEAPDRSPAFFTMDGQGHAMGRGGWTFINRFATKHPGLVVFDTSWSTAEYDMVVPRPPTSLGNDPGPPEPPDLIALPDDIPSPAVGGFG